MLYVMLQKYQTFLYLDAFFNLYRCWALVTRIHLVFFNKTIGILGQTLWCCVIPKSHIIISKKAAMIMIVSQRCYACLISILLRFERPQAIYTCLLCFSLFKIADLSNKIKERMVKIHTLADSGIASFWHQILVLLSWCDSRQIYTIVHIIVRMITFI